MKLREYGIVVYLQLLLTALSFVLVISKVASASTEEMTVEAAIKLGLKNNYDIQIARNTAEIAINKGKLTVDIEDIKPAAISFMLLYGRGISLDELNQYLNQKLATIPFTLPFQELEAIAVEGGEVVIRGR